MDIYPDCDLNRWSVRDCCAPVLAPADDYYNKRQIDKMLEESKSDLTELQRQVAENATRILNTYTKEETNDLVSNFLTKLEANHIVANYAGINGEILILNKENIN